MSSRTPVSSACSALDPATYEPHAVHAGGRTYPETNCYTDILVELLHARGDEPLAALGFTCASTSRATSGRSSSRRRATSSAVRHRHPRDAAVPAAARTRSPSSSRAGRTMIVELDAWYLPDTAATSYRTEHVKTSVVAEAIDLDGERLRYFHNAALYELEGDDYRGVFRLGRRSPTTCCRRTPSSCRFDAGPRLRRRRRCAPPRSSCSAHHLDAAPATQPVRALRRAARRRPAGAARRRRRPATTPTRSPPCAWPAPAFELLRVARRLAARRRRRAGVRRAAARSSRAARCSSFKLARRRAFDPEPAVAALAAAWDEAHGAPRCGARLS